MATQIIFSPANDSGYLPEDLIVEIFMYLPVKTLVRFTSVCKRWKDMIKNPKFAISHYMHQLLSHNPPLPSLLLFRSDNYIYSLDIDTSVNLNLGRDTAGYAKGKFVPLTHPDLKGCLVRNDDYFRPLGYCLGIICIRVVGANQIYLWNPHTNQCRSVGHPLVDKVSKNYMVYRSGFGFVPSINDYKIVLLTGKQYYREFLRQIFVYSLRANNWRELGLDTTDKSVLKLLQSDNLWRSAEVVESLVLNEVLHWIVKRSDQSYILIKFDLVNEIFLKEINIKTKIYQLSYSIGTAGDDKLCVCLLYGHPKNAETCVMVKHGNNQVKWKSLVKIKGEWRYIGSDHSLLGIAGHGKVLIMQKEMTNFDRMLIVDRRQQPPSYIELSNEYMAPHKPGIAMEYVMSYVPSLVSPFSL